MKRLITITATVLLLLIVASPALALSGLRGGWQLKVFAPQCQGGGFSRGQTCYGAAQLFNKKGIPAAWAMTICYEAAAKIEGPWYQTGCFPYGEESGTTFDTGLLHSEPFTVSCNPRGIWYRSVAAASVEVKNHIYSTVKTSVALKPAC